MLILCKDTKKTEKPIMSIFYFSKRTATSS